MFTNYTAQQRLTKLKEFDWTATIIDIGAAIWIAAICDNKNFE